MLTYNISNASSVLATRRRSVNLLSVTVLVLASNSSSVKFVTELLVLKNNPATRMEKREISKTPAGMAYQVDVLSK